ncbi:hypothetical protein SAMN04487906_0905 [Zhouia amylolytica]|uniref:Uncharacterized protein n=1 Tax=Zhouia amylolytica TaxID=376730 RepID=A0A1I6QVG9_9FLAO|nr:hypothetical protein [Zhouia amylolytica]SFS56402.1 hypothetical protein SAMN04487906_0905 [Zhouia amylolytica]
MKTINNSLLIAFLFLPLYVISLSAQNNKTTVYHWFDDVVGIENTAIYTGVQYKEVYRTYGDKHKFLFSYDFLNGDIMYEGQVFEDVMMKYDVYEHNVIVKLNGKFGESVFRLIRNHINQFSIRGHIFYNITQDEEFLGFYEILSDQNSNITLLKKYRKKAEKKLNKDNVYYEFTEEPAQYVLYYFGEYYDISNYKDLVQISKKSQPEMSQYVRKNKKLLDIDADSFYIGAMSVLAEQQ